MGSSARNVNVSTDLRWEPTRGSRHTCKKSSRSSANGSIQGGWINPKSRAEVAFFPESKAQDRVGRSWQRCVPALVGTVGCEHDEAGTRRELPEGHGWRRMEAAVLPRADQS